MATAASSPAPAPAAAPAQLAKGALRRLAQAQAEPTPENYARAYAEEAGLPPPAAAPTATAAPAAPAASSGDDLRAWAALVERLARNLERGGRQWTAARRKDSLKRVFDSSRSDPQRLLQRLQSLQQAWESDSDPGTVSELGALDEAATATPAAAAGVAPAAGAAAAGHWPPLVAALEGTLRAALPPEEPRARLLADRLQAAADRIASAGATDELVDEVAALCAEARRLLGHRHHLVEQLAALCREMGAGLAELAEDDSWVRGQCQALAQQLDGEPSVRALRAAGALLAETRQRQQQLRDERRAARDALKRLIQDMLREVGDLDQQAGRFTDATAAHVQAIESAESLDGLAGVVRSLLADSRALQQAVGRSRERLQADRARADELETRVRELESELRRLSDEVGTDALTQVANRRGLESAFAAERARAERDTAATLAVALIDIDNFKKLNDSLGHAAGDQALKALAAAVRERLRPVDHLARFGGEEFVVLLPGTPLADAQQALTRLQRSLSEALFLHEGREVFVTFSAGVTAWRPGEALAVALERADEALYEAKRTGKNRTCSA
ncbi:MAG: diguanylate cyclase [Rubrivivax sp.]|nr:diguanylate cyclase [Rubrivivax sp.]